VKEKKVLLEKVGRSIHPVQSMCQLSTSVQPGESWQIPCWQEFVIYNAWLQTTMLFLTKIQVSLATPKVMFSFLAKRGTFST